jgi:ribosome recycling factor
MNKSDYVEFTEKMEKTIEVMQTNFAAVRREGQTPPCLTK